MKVLRCQAIPEKGKFRCQLIDYYDSLLLLFSSPKKTNRNFSLRRKTKGETFLLVPIFRACNVRHDPRATSNMTWKMFNFTFSSRIRKFFFLLIHFFFFLSLARKGERWKWVNEFCVLFSFPFPIQSVPAESWKNFFSPFFSFILLLSFLLAFLSLFLSLPLLPACFSLAVCKSISFTRTLTQIHCRENPKFIHIAFLSLSFFAFFYRVAWKWKTQIFHFRLDNKWHFRFINENAFFGAWIIKSENLKKGVDTGVIVKCQELMQSFKCNFIHETFTVF